MTLGELKELLPLLKTHGVSEFKSGDTHIFLRNKEQDQASPGPISTQNHTIQVPDSQLPVDLRTDPVTDADKALYWSSPDAAGASDTIGADDQPLVAQ